MPLLISILTYAYEAQEKRKFLTKNHKKSFSFLFHSFQCTNIFICMTKYEEARGVIRKSMEKSENFSALLAFTHSADRINSRLLLFEHFRDEKKFNIYSL